MKKFWEAVLAFGPLTTSIISVGCIALFEIGILFLAIYAAMTGTDPEEFSSMLLGIFAIVMMLGWLGFFYLTIIFCMFDTFLFCIYACKNENLDTGMKVLWCFLFIFFSPITCPIYWGIYKRKEKKSENIHKIPY